MKLTFEIKRTWGNEWYYPACDASKFIFKLMERTALKKKEIDEMRDHGWEIVLK